MSAPPPAGGGPLRASAPAGPGTAVAVPPRQGPAGAAGSQVREGVPAVAVSDVERVADADSSAGWQRALAAVNQRKRMLGAFLEDCRFLGRSGEAVLLAMDDLHRAVVEEKDNRAMLVEELRRAFGRPVELRCVALGEAGLEPRRPAEPAAVAPLIEQAIAFFEGDVLAPPGRATERMDG
jgi:hypothetical protein